MRALGIALLAVMLASFLYLPVVQEVSADHVYSHRYVVRGRVVDDAGDPISQGQVNIELDGWFPRDEGISGQGLCREGGAQRTGDTTWVTATSPTGDYEICFHAHQLQPAGRVVVSAADVTETSEKDLQRRVSLVNLVVPTNSTGETGDVETFSEQLLVRGRLWQPISGEQPLEGIPVKGTSPVGKAVTMTLELADGTNLTQEATTDNYGDFNTVFETDADLEGATVTFATRSEGEMVTETVDVDPQFRAVYKVFIIPNTLETSDSPGFGVLAMMVGAVLAVGLVAVYRRQRR